MDVGVVEPLKRRFQAHYWTGLSGGYGGRGGAEAEELANVTRRRGWKATEVAGRQTGRKAGGQAEERRCTEGWRGEGRGAKYSGHY